MYHIHTTPGIILKEKAYGEADKIFSIFTRDLGLVQAVAKSVRLEKSKLRYSLKELLFLDFSFVHGKEIWRLTDVAQNGNKTIGKEDMVILMRISKLLKSLLGIESPHSGIYDCLYSLRKYMEEKPYSEEEREVAESLTVIRILHELGYVGEIGEIKDYLTNCDLNSQILSDLLPQKKNINKEINKGLKASHLVV